MQIKRCSHVEGLYFELIPGQTRYYYAQTDSEEFYDIPGWIKENGGYQGSVIHFFDLETGITCIPFPKERNVVYGNPIFCDDYIYFLQGDFNKNTMTFSEEFFSGKECAIEVKVKVVYGGKENDIISQYVDFTKVYNEQVKLHGRSREAVTETIRICKDRDVLREFLADREKEVISIMMSLFDDERIMRTHIASEKKETARKAAEQMLKMGKLSAEEIASCFAELTLEDIREIEKAMLQTV